MVLILAKTNYGALNDNTLAALSKKGDEKAFEEITIRYIKLLYSIADKYNIDGYETQDIVQEGLLAFLIAAKTFDENSGASFKNYASKCAKNRFNDLAKKDAKKSSVPKSRIVSIDTVEDRKDEAQNIEDYVLEREYLKTLIQHMDSMLSSDEKKVFNMYAQGYSYKEIGDKIKTSPKKVDNILQKIKRKFRNK